MLDLDANREGTLPRDAATVLLVRDRGEEGPRLEVFVVVRHVKSGFLGGAVVFPGGKVDDSDRDPRWDALAQGAPAFLAAEDPKQARAFAVAACREALEEAAILPATRTPLDHKDALALRTLLAGGGRSLYDTLEARGLSLDLGLLRPFARWVTPIAELRRFDTRFFLAKAPRGQDGAHDAHETTASFWAPPREILQRFDAGEIQLAPPTHRCLELLAPLSTADDAMRLAERLGKEPICPKLVTMGGDTPGSKTMALVLPGDPEHDVREERVPGLSRFVLRGERWLPEAPTSLPGTPAPR